MAFARRLVQPASVAEKLVPPARTATPAAPPVRPAAPRAPVRPAPLPFVAAASEPADDRLARLEKRVAELERHREAGPPPSPTARAPEPDRTEEIRALVKVAVDEALATQRARDKAREPVRRQLSDAPPVDVQWSIVPLPSVDAPRVAPPPLPPPVIAAYVAPPVAAPIVVAPRASIVPRTSIAPMIPIPSPHEPLGFDIPDGLDGAARRRRVAWQAFVFLLLVVGGLIVTMLVSRNR
jgi:hypothetical protein